ncbi:MAG TPA: S8 family serine peptidase [Candidatus Baltobacteraceae bacterium]|nr:S8 family serine peptidase [Candidatus Baltobacteraceae bacterium]
MRSGLRLTSIMAISSLLLTACGGGGGSGTTTPPTATPSPTPNSAACPTSGSLPTAAVVATGIARRAPARVSAQPAYEPGALAVTYDPARSGSQVDVAIARLGPAQISDLDFDAIGVRNRIVRIDPAQTEKAMAALQAVPGVHSVSRIAYRHHLSVTSNDPYYLGFGAPAPYYETSSTPGQWDMHATNVAGGWNAVTSSAPVVGTTAPIAIVDTGVDVTQPEMKGKVIRTRCFVTYPSGSAQSTGSYVTDTDGHGTNVAGIASADTDNGIGFAGESYDAAIMAYRIFPSDPSGGCDISNPPAQCDSNTADEASAINDAVANGAKVISLSLGGSPPCGSSDPEYQAVENAIAHGVSVVAAAGNGDSNGVGLNALDCPANDPGVIAVGASALNDSGTSIVEKVASYSNYLTTRGNGAHGAYLIAPGGDPMGSNDQDNLHWIENIYSSTAVQFASQACGPDYNGADVGDCKILIAGTSQATPHVAGVAALIRAARPSYTPAQVAAAICNSAVSIGSSKQGCGLLDAANAVVYAKSH